MRIYLCSRLAFDARRLNVRSASSLRGAGYDVFVPHEAAHNQNIDPSVLDEDVYRFDMSEMRQAGACVVVGRVGVDCAFEVGWFQAQGVPTIWYVPPGVHVASHPMLSAVPKVRSLKKVLLFLQGTATEQNGRGDAA